MVGPRSHHSRSARSAYLALALFATFSLIGCIETQPEITIVELQFIDTKTALPVITQTLPKNIEFNTAGQKIIFMSDEKAIQTTLSILKNLDIPPIEYEVNFRIARDKNVKRYSTETKTHLPMQGVRVSEGEVAQIKSAKTIFYPFFDEATKLTVSEASIKLKKISALNSRLTLTLLGTNRKEQQSFESSWVIPHNRWQSIAPSTNSHHKKYSTKRKSPLAIEVRVTPTALQLTE